MKVMSVDDLHNHVAVKEKRFLKSINLLQVFAADISREKKI